jgi:hypothetical protein
MNIYTYIYRYTRRDRVRRIVFIRSRAIPCSICTAPPASPWMYKGPVSTEGLRPLRPAPDPAPSSWSSITPEVPPVRFHSYTCIYIYINVYIHIYLSIFLNTYIYVYICIHMYIYIYLKEWQDVMHDGTVWWWW